MGRLIRGLPTGLARNPSGVKQAAEQLNATGKDEEKASLRGNGN